MNNYTSRSTFRPRWCGGVMPDGSTCGHTFDNEYRRGVDNEADELLTAAARFRQVDQHGEARLHFAIVTHCPKCGTLCDETWAAECSSQAPDDSIYRGGE